jgi:hypothetical protein
MKRAIIGSDPGGIRVLNELYPATLIENNWIKSNEFSKMHYQLYDEICIGTSVTMQVEKVIISNAPSGKITLILDEIYNVRKRLNLLGDILLQKINHIIYIEGTSNEEIYSGVDYSFFRHPSLSLKTVNCDYTYNSSGPLILIDEYKPYFEFIENNFNRQLSFLSNIITKSSSLVYRSHPARRNHKLQEYNANAVSGAIGYTTNYLIETLKRKIPTYTCSHSTVECILNKYAKRSSKVIQIGGLKFNQLSIDFKFESRKQPRD